MGLICVSSGHCEGNFVEEIEISDNWEFGGLQSLQWTKETSPTDD